MKMSISSSTTSGPKGKSGGNEKKNIFIIVGVLVAVVLAGLIFSQRPEDTTPKEKGVIYYTGVRYNVRNGKWVDEKGHVVPRPAGESDPPAAPDTSTRTTKE